MQRLVECYREMGIGKAGGNKVRGEEGVLKGSKDDGVMFEGRRCISKNRVATTLKSG